MEREAKEKPAGLRTMSLVCLGSCVFTLASYAFTTDYRRLGAGCAQIVTGIGFLGGGMLLRGPAGITGATTAATIWVVAAMGIVIGTGHCIGGIALTLLIVGVLRTVGAWEQTRFGGGHELKFSVVFDPARGKTLVRVRHTFEEFGLYRDRITNQTRVMDGFDGRVLSGQRAQTSHAIVEPGGHARDLRDRGLAFPRVNVQKPPERRSRRQKVMSQKLRRWINGLGWCALLLTTAGLLLSLSDWIAIPRTRPARLATISH
jgi:putative Mg2+ transporter-C (MgtC) family protein